MHNNENKSFRKDIRCPIWGLIRYAASLFFFFSLCILPVSAAEEDITEEVDSDVQTVEEVSQVIEYNIQFDEPITTIQVDPVDYYNEQNPVSYVTGSAYQGSFNSTALNYFTGVMLNNVGKNYVAFRGSQYIYYLFYGDDILYNGQRFTGSGLDFISYNSQNGTFDRGTDDLSISDNNAVVYSNIDDKFANIVEVKTVEETRSQSIVCASIFILLSILWFFKR
ncbi:MAG: hypothetical protein IJ362_07395 [Oscillospiraceae bacterium]|nr:hypothetical protein [Oscillospiraceae bacterium]